MEKSINKLSFRFYKDREVRAVWNEDVQRWYFSVLDVLGAINEQDDYAKTRNYWKYLKAKLKKEGNELVSATTQLIEKSHTPSAQLLLSGSDGLAIGQSVSAQLKMYLAYYRKNIMQPDDNPPVGILMCSEVGQEMAEYTLLDTDEDIFISKYELNIPSKERMAEFLRKENERLNKEDKA